MHAETYPCPTSPVSVTAYPARSHNAPAYISMRDAYAKVDQLGPDCAP